MFTVTVGVTAILISALGALSNWLNWKYLNSRITAAFYYLGALVHELSHAALCLVTGAKIREISVFSSQPHVTYERPRVPIIGAALISFAPIAGGLLFLFLVNNYVLGGHFIFPHPSGWADIGGSITRFLGELRPLDWRSWVMIVLFLNAGAMLGPSLRDLKNIWPVLLVLLFVPWAAADSWGIFAIELILVNIVIQIVIILIATVISFFFRKLAHSVS